MEISCPACAARYKADEQKLRGRTARMRCKACDTVWIASAPSFSGPGTAEATTDERRAAVVRRGAEREHRDLFASRPVDFGSVKQTLRPPPPEPTGVAARNETSVLFTVDALRGTARVKTPEPEPSPLSTNMGNPHEDSGIIDLHALASVPPKPGQSPVAPLFSEPPPAAFTREVSSPSSETPMASGGLGFGKRAIAGIAAAAVAVVLVGVGVAAVFKGEEPAVRNAVTAAAPPPATVAAPAPKPVEPPPPVVTSASSSSDDDAKAPTVGVKGKGKGKGKGGKAVAAGSSKLTKVSSSGVSSEPKVSKPAASAPDKCGCKGDFNCVIRCAAKGK